MREIGGYLEFENLIHNEYYPDAIALNTARNAFVYLANARKIAKVYIPYFLCDSIYNVCKRENISYEFYHIDRDFHPIFDKKLAENEFLYIVNYYGQLSSDEIREYSAKFKNIIIDNVQAFFADPVDAVDTIYSCRKFFGVPDGAYLVSNAAKQELPTDVSYERVKHILGRYDTGIASEYYGDFSKNEVMFEELPLMYMSKITRNILGAVDYKLVISKRNENRQILHEALSKENKLSLKQCNGPYMYPFYCNNGAEIRSELVKKKIYIPTLWPNVKDLDAFDYEKDFAENILPLPVDQRYDTDDMMRLIEGVKGFL